MKAKQSILIAAIAIIILGAAAAFYFVKRNSNPGAAETSVADNSQITSAQTDTNQPKQEPKMPNYDLSLDSDGLSKAVATLTLEKGGVIKWRFYSNDAPNTVKRITQLISEGFYNGIIFHRVVPRFVVQAGDPNGIGSGGSGVKLKAEFNSHKHVPGILSMARTSDPDSADSQFFIMIGAAPHLDNQYTVFGKVVEGYENVEKIQQGDKIATFTIE